MNGAAFTMDMPTGRMAVALPEHVVMADWDCADLIVRTYIRRAVVVRALEAAGRRAIPARIHQLWEE